MHSLFTVVLSTVERNRHDMFRPLSAPVTLQALTAQHRALMRGHSGRRPAARASIIGEHLE